MLATSRLTGIWLTTGFRNITLIHSLYASASFDDTHTHTHTESAVPVRWAAGLFHGLVSFEAAVLLAAAILKVWLLAFDSFPELRTGYPTTILFLAIAVELVFAGYLLIGRDLAARWLMLACLFGTFLAISITRLLLGVSGCGCLGAVELPRWILPMNSILVLVILAVLVSHRLSRPMFDFRKLFDMFGHSFANPTFAGCLAGVIVIAVAFALFPWFRQYPPVSQFFDEPPLRPIRFAAGDLVVGRTVDVSVPWRNDSPQWIEVLGSQSSCTCIGLTRTRFTAGPSEEVELTLQVRPRKPGFFHQRIVCFVDYPLQDRLTLDVIANAVMPHKEY